MYNDADNIPTDTTKQWIIEDLDALANEAGDQEAIETIKQWLHGAMGGNWIVEREDL